MRNFRIAVQSCMMLTDRILGKPHLWIDLEGDIPFKHSNFTYLFNSSLINTNVSVLSVERKKNDHRLQSMMMQMAHMGLCEGVCFLELTTGVMK